MKVFIALTMVLAAGVLQVASAGSQVLKSSTDAGGKQHPATVTASGPASITCTSVSGTNASCYLTGPGIEKQVQKTYNVLTISAGKVTLVCNGSGVVTCEARVDVPPSVEK